MGINGFCESSNFLGYIIFYFVDLIFKLMSKFLISFQVIAVNNFGMKRFFIFIVFIENHIYFSYTKLVGISFRAHNNNFIPIYIFDFFVPCPMVVPYKDNIKSRNLFGNNERSIFISGCIIIYISVSIVVSRMEKTNEQIGFFFLLNYWNPFFGRFNHIDKFDTFPQFFG